MNYPKSSDLEKDLVSRLRESASGNARAMAATVVVAAAAADSDAGDALVDKLMGRRPARIIHLRTGAALSEGFRSWSAARCSLDRQNRGVCFEDIYIESSNEAAVDPRSWGSLVMRELPALLHWRFPVAALRDSECDCAERVDLVVIDGGIDPALTRDGAVAYARQVLEAANKVPALADLSWERSESARTATSRLFDAPGSARALASLTSIESSGSEPWGAALHAGWAAAALGLRGEASSVDGTGPWRRPNGSAVSVLVGASRFPSCVFRFADGTSSSAEFTSDRDVTLRFQNGSSLAMLFPAPDDGASLARLVDAPLADPLYTKALSALSG